MRTTESDNKFRGSSINYQNEVDVTEGDLLTTLQTDNIVQDRNLSSFIVKSVMITLIVLNLSLSALFYISIHCIGFDVHYKKFGERTIDLSNLTESSPWEITYIVSLLFLAFIYIIMIGILLTEALKINTIA